MNGPVLTYETFAVRSQKTEKALGGDGKWIDDFKLLPSKKSS